MATFTKPDRLRAIREAMTEVASEPFEYGRVDCAHFADRVAQKLSGRSYLAGLAYSTEEEAEAIIAAHGSLSEACEAVIGLPATQALEDGDPCIVQIPTVGEAVGVFCQNSAIVKTKGSAVRMPARSIVKGWNLCHRQ